MGSAGRRIWGLDQKLDGAMALARPSPPYGLARRFLRGFIHFFSYHLILARQSDWAGARKEFLAGLRVLTDVNRLVTERAGVDDRAGGLPAARF